MKLNNKGFAISTVMYILLIVSLMLIMATLSILNSRKMNLDKIKSTTLSEIKENLNVSDKYTKYDYGSIVRYHGVDYYVIQDNGEDSEYVVGLKTIPLTYDEISHYSLDIQNNNNYGYIAFNSDNYNSSNVKNVLDQWKDNNVNIQDLKIVAGSKYQLFNINHYNIMINKINEWREIPGGTNYYNKFLNQLYLSDCAYFMLNNNTISVVNMDQTIATAGSNDKYAIRPVLNIYKDRLDDINE